jgi:hypothetical protein
VIHVSLISVSFKANQNRSIGEHFFDNRLPTSEAEVEIQEFNFISTSLRRGVKMSFHLIGQNRGSSNAPPKD